MQHHLNIIKMEMVDFFEERVNEYPIISIEDGIAEEELENVAEYRGKKAFFCRF